MTQAQEVVDISEMPELLRLVERVREAGQPLVLKVKNEVVATIALTTPDLPEMVGVLTREQFERAMSAAGGWKGLVDGEKLKAEIKAARGQKPRNLDL